MAQQAAATPEELARLADFKPLKRLEVPDLGDVDCAGLVVLVGPNSSGKSQLLQDVYNRLAGMPRQLVVAKRVEVSKPPLASFLRVLEDEGYFETIEDDGGNKHLRPRTMYLGSGQALPQIQPQQARQMYDGFSTDADQSTRRQVPFLNHFGRLLVTALFLDRRLTSLTPVGVIDFDSQAPQHDLHVLYLDDAARERLNDEMLSSFGRAVWPDMSRGNTISLKVSETGVLPPAYDRLSHRAMAKFRSIESEGDGMKSYVATCVALLLGRRPVCLIDEPEMCLHPPQAYNLGRFIGRYAATRDTVTIVATHSSHLLRGILQMAKELQVVRLTRKKTQFSAHLVSAERLAEALERPTLRAESVLDGIFAQAVAVVEADGDRLVYQAVWETLQSDYKIDLHFATVGGTGGIADTCGLYRALRIPIAVIADLDVLVDTDRLERVLAQLVADAALRKDLIRECVALAAEIRALPPTMTPEQVVTELNRLLRAPMDWQQGHDVSLRRAVSKLGKQIDRMRRLKAGGVEAYEDDLGQRMRTVLDKLSARGIFLVEKGELEQWLAEYDVGVSIADKRAWANAAAQRVQEVGRQPGDVWDFVARVASFLIA
jgi:putative AbiEii toxin of type IV toxin-antitoxin system/OLD-like protein